MSMNIIFLQSIGWALVHSLWQSALLYILYTILSRLPKVSTVNYRYILATAMLGLMLVAFASTMLIIAGSGQSHVMATGTYFISSTVAGIESAGTDLYNSFERLGSWIDNNLLWVIRFWLVGAVVGMLRVVSGVAYLYMLRRRALPVYGEWEEKMRGLSAGMNILRRIELAEARVSTPIVIGLLKPVILFPVGLMAGLTAAQIEAILVHELAHIRRHDFLVNLFQCLMESIFFFNPFVWLLSARIRALREECCDDVVLRRGVAPLIYVKTLAHVEEVSAHHILAPAFAGQRNQLLNRMKRIMEKSAAKKEWGTIRLLPLWLALMGLACASWLSIGTGNAATAEVKYDPSIFVTPTDTIINNQEKDLTAPFEYRNDGDESTYWLPQDQLPADAIPGVSEAPPLPGFESLDSIPPFHLYAPAEEWEKFEKEFTTKFRQEFRDFFDKNREQFEKMMEELRRQHGEDWAFAVPPMGPVNPKVWDDFVWVNPSVPNMENPQVPEFPTLDEKWMEEHSFRLEEQARAMSNILHGQEEMLRMQEDLLHAKELMHLGFESDLRDYEEAIVEQLIEDGYLEKGEKLNDLHIRNDEITVNGKKIKEKDQQKYREIREKFEPRWSKPHRPE